MYALVLFIIVVIFYIVTRDPYFTAALAILLSVPHYNKIYQFVTQWKTPEPFEDKLAEAVKRVNQDEPIVIESIPSIITQVWVQKDGGPSKIPTNQVQYMDKIRKMNPSFQYMLFEKKEIDDFFMSNYAEYYDTYKRLPFFIQTLDFFRYLAIYHYGGFYFDTDVKPNKLLDSSILNHSAVFPVDEYASSIGCENTRMKMFCSKGQHFLLGQYAFGATAKHPFLKFMVDKIKQNLEKYIRVAGKLDANDREAVHYFVFKTTGPDFVTDCYLEYTNKEHIYILSNGRRQMFGDYAEHKYVGSWK